PDWGGSGMYKNLIIVGGGFAGTKTAQLLEHTLPPDWTLMLISQENFITFNPLLPEVVGASIMPSHVIAPHRQMLHCSHVCMAQVSEIDTAARVVRYLGEGPGTLPYDQLVLACGTNANLDVVKGMAQVALPLKTLGDALFLRNRIIARLEQAELQPDPEHRRWLMSFIVVGGELISGGTVICTIGTQPNALLDSIPAMKSRGRLVVNPDLSVPGLEGVWAVGDCAAVINEADRKVCPPTAQFAEAQARQLAANIISHLASRPTRPFQFRPKGQLSSVGHNKAVAEVLGFKVSGFIAWLMWRGLYLLRI